MMGGIADPDKTEDEILEEENRIVGALINAGYCDASDAKDEINNFELKLIEKTKQEVRKELVGEVIRATERQFKLKAELLQDEINMLENLRITGQSIEDYRDAYFRMCKLIDDRISKLQSQAVTVTVAKNDRYQRDSGCEKKSISPDNTQNKLRKSSIRGKTE